MAKFMFPSCAGKVLSVTTLPPRRFTGRGMIHLHPFGQPPTARTGHEGQEMTSLTQTDRYDAVSRFFHWTMAGLILVVFAMGLLVDTLPRSAEAAFVNVHMVLGVLILALYAGRLGWRWRHKPPAADPSLGRFVDVTSRLGHVGLYALMIAVPLIGVALIFFRGRGIDFYAFQIPSPIAANRAVSRPMKEVHEFAAYALVGLAALHAAAALWHHWVRRDNVLRRMLPAR
jgi:cytochrome b561